LTEWQGRLRATASTNNQEQNLEIQTTRITHQRVNFGQPHIIIFVLAVIFFATFIRSALGFGEALIAVPLLSLKIPIQSAAPLAVMISITIAAFIIVQDWRKVHVRAATRLLLPTFLGIPIGLYLLTSVHQQIIKALLALILICFAVYSLRKTHGLELKRDSNRWLIACGFFAGVLGGAYGMNGPPLAVYGTMRRWSPGHFRATLQGYFLPASVLGMAGYFWRGLWTQELTHYFLLSLPVAIPAIWLGRAANRRLSMEIFFKYVFGGLIVIGFLLLFQAGLGE